MHTITELPAWERLFKQIVWQQIGEVKGLDILDFGSGEGITASHFALDNHVTAVEPSEKMLSSAWKDYEYEQIAGDISALSEFEDQTFDLVICHNVLEYIEDKKYIVSELARVLKPNGRLSIVKHNRAGRIMQMAVLLDALEEAERLLDGNNSTASQFGKIRYYADEDIQAWDGRLHLVDSFGIRTFWDLQQNQEKHGQEDWQQKMMRLELRVSQMDEYRSIAFFHHLILKGADPMELPDDYIRNAAESFLSSQGISCTSGKEEHQHISRSSHFLDR